METKHNWNGGMQHLVRKSRNEGVLQTLKEYEVQPPPVMIPMIGNGESANNKSDEQPKNSITLPWMKRFAAGGIHSQAASTIISQLNNYHRHGSFIGQGDPVCNKWQGKNEVTPPSGAIKPPWEEQGQNKLSSDPSTGKHPRDPPPLLLAGNTATVNSSMCRSSITCTNSTKQVHSLTTKKGVPHVYHDYSNVPDVVGVVRKKTGGVTQPFPEKLHTMLDNDDDPSIVSWLPHGRAFLVRKPVEFTAQIMPKYFRQTKLTSFQRQLNLYGFRRLTQGADSGAYYHELFLRGRPQLCLRMQRQKIKGTGHKQPADVQTEPNFYSMVSSSSCSEVKRTDQVDSSNQTSSSATTANTDLRQTTYKSPSFADLSPGSRGAANLLTDMKGTHCSIKGRSMLDGSFSIGQSALSSTVSNESHQSHRTLSPTSSLSTDQSSTFGNSPTTSSNELFVTKHRSMSLLGRVQKFPKPLKMKSSFSGIIDSSSAFFWPPRKTTMGSESHTTATFESSITSSPSPTHPDLQADQEKGNINN